MKKLAAILIFLFVQTYSMAQDNFIGVWVNPVDKEEIEIYKENEYYYAKINNTKLDTVMVLIQMVYKSPEKLYGGTYVDNKTKNEVEAKVKISNNNELTIIIVHRETIFNSRRKYIKHQPLN